MAPVIIVGAMIGAGVGGVVSGMRGGSIWKGAAIGAGAGALSGWGASAAGLGAAPSALGAGEASVGAAAPAAESMVTPASEILGATSINSPFTAQAPSLMAGLTSKEILSGASGIASIGSSLLNSGIGGYSDAEITPSTKASDDIGPELRELTPEESAAKNARHVALDTRYNAARIGEGARQAAALSALRSTYEDPRAYYRTSPSAQNRRQGALSTAGGFRFNQL